jgi:predicted Zn finger-like uncharacterized protein
MNRITRCPSCATVYQVGDVQLKQARGWLRCSHCAHVFDSTGLVLDWGPSIPVGQHNLPAVSAMGPGDGVPSAPPLGAAERIDLDAFLHTPDFSALGRPASEELASFEQALSSFQPVPWQEPAHGPATDPGPPSRHLDARPAASAVPESAPKRGGLGALAAVVLACTLMFQLIFAQRSAIVAHWPAMAPGLAHACSWVGCRVPPLRDPEALVIESSAMVQRDIDHVLSWTLRNTSGQTLGVTAMEISLLDAQDQVLVRRVVQVSEWGGAESLAPGQVDSAQLVVRMDPALPVSGYRFLSFYP